MREKSNKNLIFIYIKHDMKVKNKLFSTISDIPRRLVTDEDFLCRPYIHQFLNRRLWFTTTVLNRCGICLPKGNHANFNDD